MSELQVAAYRVHSWIDTSEIARGMEELPILYGIQAKLAGRRGWLHMAEKSEVLLFKDLAQAEDWIKHHPVGPIQGRLAVARRSPEAPSSSLATGG